MDLQTLFGPKITSVDCVRRLKQDACLVWVDFAGGSSTESRLVLAPKCVGVLEETSNEWKKLQFQAAC